MSPGSVDPEVVALRLAVVRERIARAGGDPERVRIVAVTKGFGADAVGAALAAGLPDAGENYAQELVAKSRALGPDARLRWHFVGRLQRNKVRAVAGLVSLWQSIDRQALVDELAARAPGAAVLVQLNVSGEAGKGGCRPADAPAMVAAARDAGLDVRGLMGVAAAGRPDEARVGFRRLREVADRLGLPERSMGMTGDLELAVQEGSTMLRLGRALFGERPAGRGP